ncbi:MAG: hypothetical protein FWG96_01170 [Methanomassiliicoccaceae archaeon]|nr:hypothetical protein [Methanomassiliicoccaceae archaeon]
MQRMTSKETIISRGVYVKERDTYKSGALGLVFGVLFLFLTLFFFLLRFSSPYTSSDGRVVLEIGFFDYLILMVIVIFTVAFLAIIGVSNMYYGRRAKEADYSAGEARTFLTLITENKQMHLMGEIEVEYPCPECNANTRSPLAKYCPQCGHVLSSEEDGPE